MPMSETAPLLSRPTIAFPTISDALLRLDEHVDRAYIEDLCPRDVADICSGIAFRLVVLLQLRRRKLRPKPSSDIWNHWTEMTANESDINRIDEQILNAWDLFLNEYRTAAEIERVLWTSFPANAESSSEVRVVDLLDAHCPSELICHKVFILSIVNRWKHGPCPEVPPELDSVSRISLRYDAMCTPRVLHCVDLVAHLSYFGLLVSYVMHPPYEPTDSDTGVEYIGSRKILLMVFSLSILFRPWTVFKIPTIILLIIFAIHLPAVPFAGSVGFDILLLCFVCHALQFHFPIVPSPLFLFKVHRSLPFAAFLAHGFYNIILPITLFFLPIFVLGTTWLSIALAETFFAPSSLLSFIPTPIQTRTTVLYMFFTLLVATTCSLFIFAVQGRGLDSDAAGWDAYSSKVGRTARASFARAVITYSSPYTFPAPFSLLQAVLISGPSFAAKCLGLALPFAQAEKLLWRISVGPLGFLCGLVMMLFP
ncbi:hypothetical protein GGX14DRAFT_425987 [Mycena pura]|uniref:Uncharacterized protein n=1 Tax=Mycena pura TaxID=153505 RepID=A0AAD6YNF0_9AGAR|nr:hypothetical protein GGX14DRAFT_425987 [Mycena pura]